MFIVKCRLDNASECISGVAFSENEDGHMVTEEVGPEVAAIFEGIGGYEIIDASKDPKAIERDAILAEAAGLGMKLDGRLSTDKLRAQLDTLKADAAKAGA